MFTILFEIVKTDVYCELVFMTANSIFHKFSQCTKLVFMTTNSIFINLVNVPETVAVLGPSSHHVFLEFFGEWV